MNRIHFSANIKAGKEKVWKTLWNDSTYRQWTSVFDVGSYAVSDWKEGSKALFFSSNGGGLYSIIDQMIPNELMSFKHLGILKDGKEQINNEETNTWSGSMETYILKEHDGFTELSVELDTTEAFMDFFDKTFPKALEMVKMIAEK